MSTGLLAPRRASVATRALARATSIPLSFGAILAVSIGWTAVLLRLAVERHETIRSHRFDLGNMVQVVWSTAHGRLFELTLGSGEQANRLGVHVDPILGLFAPLWWIFPTPLLLVATQVFALALGVLPVYWLGRRHLESDAAAVACGVAYLLYIPVAWNAVSDFHPVTLAVPLLLWAFWFLDADRLRPFAFCAVLALSTGELMGLNLAALGLWYAIVRRRRRAGLAIATAGLAWTAFCLKVVVPAFSDGASSVFYSRFAEVGGSPMGVLGTLLHDPGTLLAAVTTPEDIRYVVLLIAPLLALCLASPLVLVALPQLGVNLLAGFDSATLPQYQYGAGIVPYLVIATVFGLRRVSSRRLRPAFAWVVACTAGATLAGLPPNPGTDPYIVADPESRSRLEAIRRAIGLVPNDAPVSSTNRIGGQLSARSVVYSFPVRANADWVVVDRRDPWLAVAGEGDAPVVFRRYLRELHADSRFTLLFEQEGVLVYRKIQ